MTRSGTPEHGVEEWSCAQCGRRLLVRRPPAFERIVLERGDEWAVHVGSTGRMQTTAMGIRPAQSGGLPAQDRTWLAGHRIEWAPDDTT